MTEASLKVLRDSRTYLRILYLLLAFPLALTYFVLIVTGLSVGLGLSVIGVGLAILVLTMLGWLLAARLEREVARLEQKLKALAGRALLARRHRYEGLTARLDALSPLKVLARGYAVAFDQRGHALLQASQVQPGERVRVRLHEGELSAQVVEEKNE